MSEDLGRIRVREFDMWAIYAGARALREVSARQRVNGADLAAEAERAADALEALLDRAEVLPYRDHGPDVQAEAER